ncbi:unnamed protein product [Oncorhynchus mykiss]|uniref:Uncharacterized protein n=1 Tax=Oncorhynchus mykiss TaxID=8022 RepID=A0A060W7P7_ONCMY|nr:unnamed protein product [Oncorhynchus mykiss]
MHGVLVAATHMCNGFKLQLHRLDISLDLHVITVPMISKEDKRLPLRSGSEKQQRTLEQQLWSGCITAWYGNCSAHNRKALQRVVRSAQRITGGKLPALQDTYTTRCHRKAIKIIKDNNHPSHCLFTPLSSRRRGQYRCIKAGTERLKNSFYLKAIRLLNSHH